MGLTKRTLKLLICTCLVQIAFSAQARAEYRVFELLITNSTTGQSRTVQSTLDHIQYPSYHPLRKDETVQIADTWMCRNRSDISQDPAQKYCPSPRAPASSTVKKPSAP